jgi:Fe2+ or Zn2+ uptake regulation protein
MRGDPDAKALGRAAFGPTRMSVARLVVARAVDDTAGYAFTVGSLAADVRRLDPSIGLATVYRAVVAMEATGFIEALDTRDGSVRYARCTHRGHHHHVLCTGCGAVADVECTVAVTPPGSGGFAVAGHRLVLYGTCGACTGGGGCDEDQPA